MRPKIFSRGKINEGPSGGNPPVHGRETSNE